VQFPFKTAQSKPFSERYAVLVHFDSPLNCGGVEFNKPLLAKDVLILSFLSRYLKTDRNFGLKADAFKRIRGRDNSEDSCLYRYLCSFRMVIGDVLVSAMPGMARKISPTK
jgi:hypothetical protein